MLLQRGTGETLVNQNVLLVLCEHTNKLDHPIPFVSVEERASKV